jgi:hypothetical protein
MLFSVKLLRGHLLPMTCLERDCLVANHCYSLATRAARALKFNWRPWCVLWTEAPGPVRTGPASRRSSARPRLYVRICFPHLAHSLRRRQAPDTLEVPERQGYRASCLKLHLIAACCKRAVGTPTRPFVIWGLGPGRRMGVSPKPAVATLRRTRCAGPRNSPLVRLRAQQSWCRARTAPLRQPLRPLSRSATSCLPWRCRSIASRASSCKARPWRQRVGPPCF